MRTKVAKKYLLQLRERYEHAKRNEKHIILNELTKTGFFIQHSFTFCTLYYWSLHFAWCGHSDFPSQARIINQSTSCFKA